MSAAGQVFKRVLLVIYLIFVHTIAGLFVIDHFVAPYIYWDDSFFSGVRPPGRETPIPTPMPVPSIVVDAPVETEPVPAETNNSDDSNRSSDQQFPRSLMIPVKGVSREQLIDSFSDSRSENRIHDAIDIPAPEGTPVVAAADGEIARFFDSEKGGVTIYQLSTDRRYVFYYAHLQKRAEGLKEKDFVKQGTVIGYVGDTGNAIPGNFHLHFSIMVPSDTSRYWDGAYVNPYPLLKNGLEAR